MKNLWIDIETISRINVVTAGVYAHAEDPELDITMAAYAVDSGPIDLWTSIPEPGTVSTPPEELEALLRDPNVLVWAHNAAYERLVIRAVWGIEVPLERWRDSAVVARWYNMPGSLEAFSSYALGMPVKMQIDTKVKALWDCGSLPWGEEDLARFETMGEYCVKDVDAMRRAATSLPALPDRVWHDYVVSETINDRGVAVDITFAENVSALHKVVDVDAKVALQMLMFGTHGQRSPRSPQNLDWFEEKLAGRYDEPCPLLDEKGQLTRLFKVRRTDRVGFKSVYKRTFDKAMRASLREWLEEQNDQELLDVLDAIDEGQNAAITKFNAIRARVSNDGRLRGMYMFAGAAQTHRFSSVGAQTHNMLRDTLPMDDDYALRAAVRGSQSRDDILGTLTPESQALGLPRALSMSLRPTLMAEYEDEELLWEDWSAIEARALPWLAGDTAKLALFEKNVDVYIRNASGLFGKPESKVTKADRQVGKVMELALGYGGGKGAFAAMGRGYGVKLPTELVSRAVKTWRQHNPVIVDFWYQLERAAFTAMRKPGVPQQVGKVAYIYVPGILYGSLLCQLPDNSFLCYPNAKIEEVERYEDQPPEPAICFDHPTYGRSAIWYGTLVENITQAVCASLLRYSLSMCHATDLPVVAHTHDEIVAQTLVSTSDQNARLLADCMGSKPVWAKGLPLDTDGARGSRYKLADAAY